MARLARIVLPNVPHHVTQRGVRSMDIFSDDKDRSEYLRLMKEQSDLAGLTFIAYCLMSNHVHFIVIPEKGESLRRGIGESHRLYTRRVNKRAGASGYLFQGRFFSCPLDKNHLLNAVRYVERNPVRAGLCQRPEEYRWSSARVHVGLTPKDALIDSKKVLDHQPDWMNYISAQTSEIRRIEKCVTTGRPLGDNRFVKYAEKITGRDLGHKKMGRPSKINQKK